MMRYTWRFLCQYRIIIICMIKNGNLLRYCTCKFAAITIAIRPSDLSACVLFMIVLQFWYKQANFLCYSNLLVN